MDDQTIAATINRHAIKHSRPVSGCMVCDARTALTQALSDYQRVLAEWKDKQI